MKLIFPHYYFTTYLKLFCPRKVRISTFCGFCRKKFEKNLKKGLTYTDCSAMMWIQRKSGTPQRRLKGEKNEKVCNRIRSIKMAQKYTEAKKIANRKWDAENLTAITIRLPKKMAVDFKTKCKNDGISQAGIIKEYIEDFLGR